MKKNSNRNHRAHVQNLYTFARISEKSARVKKAVRDRKEEVK